MADLEASLGRLAEEAGLRTRQEVDSVREQGNKRLAELAEKLHQKDAVRQGWVLQRRVGCLGSYWGACGKP